MAIEEPLVSVIVPIYNVEKYLRDCLDSILKQTYSHIEILLIDDGSPDSSGTICQEYAERDGRIRYYRKENGGLSDARNYGIERAKGEYLLFVDSDDWITDDCIQVLYRAIKKYQTKIAVAPYSRYREEDGSFQLHVFDEQYYEKVFSPKDLLERLPILEVYDLSFQTSWGILSHRSLFAHVRFPKGRVNEDIGTNYKLYLQASRIVYVNRPVYWYRERLNSLTTNGLSEKKMQDDLELRLERIAILGLNGYDLTNYIHQQKQYLLDWYNGGKAVGIEQTEIMRRFHEISTLLEEN